MSGKEIELGPVGVALAENIRTLRMAQRLSFAEFSRRLAEVGRRMPVLSIRRIEEHERRVDVDDLDAIVRVLGVRRDDLLDGGDRVAWGDAALGGRIALRAPDRGPRS